MFLEANGISLWRKIVGFCPPSETGESDSVNVNKGKKKVCAYCVSSACCRLLLLCGASPSERGAKCEKKGVRALRNSLSHALPSDGAVYVVPTASVKQQ